ncbi:MAG: hypothetical protein B7X37_07795 [Halothiobacillus sp. 14-55-98]|jgi:hypothetical protein|nr:MAG: hypothetical protein B7X37_07795 [Halothiobacillus sp. 14-55-98]
MLVNFTAGLAASQRSTFIGRKGELYGCFKLLSLKKHQNLLERQQVDMLDHWAVLLDNDGLVVQPSSPREHRCTSFQMQKIRIAPDFREE